MKKLFAAIAVLALGACSSGGGTTTSEPASSDGSASIGATATTTEKATDEPTERPDVTIGLTYIPDVQFAPVYVAEANGYFDEAGVDVTIRHHGAQESLFGAVQSGEEDIVFAGGDEMLQARSTDIDIVNWATMYQTYPVTLIVKADSGIESAADLEGKSVGLPGPFGENYFALLAMIDDYDLTDVQIDYIGYTQTTALATDAVDAIIGFSNNDAVAMRHAGMDVVELPLVSGDLPLIGVGLGSMGDNLDPELLAKVLHAIDRGASAAAEDMEGTLDIVETYVPALSEAEQREISAKVLEATLELYMGGETFGYQDADRWDAMATFMEGADLLDKPVEANEVYTSDVLNYRTQTAQ